MSKKRSKMAGMAMIVPLRVPADLRARVKVVKENSRLSEADIMRLSIDRGLGQVEEMFSKPVAA